MQDISSQVVECSKHSHRTTIERTIEIDSELDIVLNKVEYGLYFVLSSVARHYYPVTEKNGVWNCTCMDHECRKRECKHIKKAQCQLPEDAYELLATTKEPSCPVCGSNRTRPNFRCEQGYCYWQAMAESEAA
jgi:hypothetical protein